MELSDKKETAVDKKKRLLAEEAQTSIELQNEIQPEEPVELDFKGRVNLEREELFVKIKALTEFTEGEVFGKLDETDRTVLLEQLDAMNLYRRALDTRIVKF